MFSVRSVLTLSVLLQVSFFSTKTAAAVIDGPENQHQCDGVLNLHTQDGTKIQVTKEDILNGVAKELGKPYVQLGQREGSCCYRLKFRRNSYYDLMTDGEHNIKSKVFNVNIIACVSRANIIVPVIGSAFALVIIATVSILLWRRYKIRRHRLPSTDTTDDES